MIRRSVVVYSQPGCPPCTWVKDFLETQGVEFTVLDISRDENAARELEALGSQSTPTVLVGRKVLIGFQREKLLEALRDL